MLVQLIKLLQLGVGRQMAYQLPCIFSKVEPCCSSVAPHQLLQGFVIHACCTGCHSMGPNKHVVACPTNMHLPSAAIIASLDAYVLVPLLLTLRKWAKL